MVGLEALSMQGLPVDKLLLTRESEDQLADLAGNAMSTTVVGACILAALVTGKGLLKEGDDTETYESKQAGGEQMANESVEVGNRREGDDEINDVVGEGQLVSAPLDLAATSAHSFSVVLDEAKRSARLCTCEGRADMTTRELLRCEDCGSTFCKKCGGRPEHNPQLIDTNANPRLPPSEFAKHLKSILPMCLAIRDVDEDILESLRKEHGSTISENKWVKWRDAVLRATDSEFRFAELKRQEIWSVVYRSSVASLELSLHPMQAEWRLFTSPEPSEPANADIRRILESPVARFICDGGLLAGHWEFALPLQISFKLKIQGTGVLVPSWEARLGLTSEKFRSQTVHSELKITAPADAIKVLDRDVSGVYTLLDKCGTANGALHKKAPSDQDSNLPPLFMLFDPHRTDDSQDCFVFSISIRRLEYMESRPIVCKLDTNWKQSAKAEEQTVAAHIPSKWVSAKNAKLKVCAELLFRRTNSYPFRPQRFSMQCLVFRRRISVFLSPKKLVAMRLRCWSARYRCMDKQVPNGLAARGGKLTRFMNVARSKHWRGCWNESVTLMTVLFHGRAWMRLNMIPPIANDAHQLRRNFSGCRVEGRSYPSRIQSRLESTRDGSSDGRIHSRLNSSLTIMIRALSALVSTSRLFSTAPRPGFLRKAVPNRSSFLGV